MTPSATITIRPLTDSGLSDAALVAATAMRDNPMHVAALGSDPERRVAVMRCAFERYLRAGRRTVLSAWSNERLVGIAAYADVGRCVPNSFERVASIPVALRAGRSAGRLLAWQREWTKRDLRHEHAHLGPVAVLPEYQGTGIGSQLLGTCTTRLDQKLLAGYLETDKYGNVEFYERFGFQIVDRAEVLGVSNWFMARSRRARAGSDGS